MKIFETMENSAKALLRVVTLDDRNGNCDTHYEYAGLQFRPSSVEQIFSPLRIRASNHSHDVAAGMETKSARLT